jgi:hypothetical protein
MEKKREKYPFEGVWDVIEVDYRRAGRWHSEFVLEPDLWSVGFLPNRKFIEIYRPEDNKESGIWDFNEADGLITIMFDDTLWELSKCIFSDGYLYFYSPRLHIRPCRDTIIEHHAHMRYRVVRGW